MTRFLPSLAFATLAITGAASAATTVGINAAIRNKVVVRAASDPVAHPAILKARVGLGDQIQTATASVLQILLLDRSNFTVGANARVTIDRFVYDPNRSASAVGASVAKGAFRFISGRSIHNMPGQTAITTPVASIGVRGTMVEDPVCGSLNAGLARWLPTIDVLRLPYIARQGTALGRDCRLTISHERGEIWVAGTTRTLIDGTLLPDDADGGVVP